MMKGTRRLTIYGVVNGHNCPAFRMDAFSHSMHLNGLANIVSRDTPITRAVILYMLRPNLPSHRQIENEIESVFPKPFDSQLTIGMPIRGSDKCYDESDCLQFEDYMDVAMDVWEELQLEYHHHHDHHHHHSSAKGLPKRGSLILTTEDKTVFDQRLNYSLAHFPYNFVVNENDVMQSSGSFRLTNVSPDKIILSSLIVMKMQFHAKYVYGNCCSNFHRLIFEMLQLGCGIQSPASARRCYPNICCGWTGPVACRKIRAEYMKTLKQRRKKQRD